MAPDDVAPARPEIFKVWCRGDGCPGHIFPDCGEVMIDPMNKNNTGYCSFNDLSELAGQIEARHDVTLGWRVPLYKYDADAKPQTEAEYLPVKEWIEIRQGMAVEFDRLRKATGRMPDNAEEIVEDVIQSWQTMQISKDRDPSLSHAANLATAIVARLLSEMGAS